MNFDHVSGSITNINTLTPNATLTVLGTSGIIVPTGNTAQRISSTSTVRFNTDTHMFEGFNGNSWLNFGGSTISGNAVINLGNVPSIQSGTFSSMPTAGQNGRLYIANDLHSLYQDSGTVWNNIKPPTYSDNSVSIVQSVTSGNCSVSIGSNNTSGYDYSVTTGLSAKTNTYGALSHASGSFTSSGDSQYSRYVLRGITNSTTPVTLALDGLTKSLTLPLNSATNMLIQIIASRTDVVGTYAAWNYNILATVGSSLSTATVVAAYVTTIKSQKGWSVNIVANTTTGSIDINVTGAAGNTIRWVAVAHNAELLNF